MIRILLFSTIALSLGSASLAFLTRQKAQELSGNLTEKSRLGDEAKANVAKLKEENKTALARIEELSKSAEAQKTQAEQTATNLKESESKGTKLEAEIAEKGKKVETLARQLEEAVAAAKPTAPTPDPAQEQLLAKLKDDLDKTKQAAEAEQKRLMQKAVELEGKVAQLTAKNKAGNGGDVSSGGRGGGSQKVVSGTVVAVNEGWNFVVVNLGDKNGVTPETQLAVQRKGKVVANLKVTEVRPKHVSAGVEYAEGNRKEKVLLGDTVVVVPRMIEPPAVDSISPNELFASPTAVP
jgi:myosin heavy subunit